MDGRASLTFVRLTDLVITLDLHSFADILHIQHHVYLRIEPDIAIANKVHCKRILAHPWWRLELTFESLHVISRFALRVDYRLVEAGECKWRYCDASLSSISEEYMPSGRVVSSVVWGRC